MCSVSRILVLFLLVASLTACRRIRPPGDVRPVVVQMEVTGYCRCGKCCNWRRTWWGRPVIASGPRRGQRKAVGITASGVRARRGTIAADKSRYPYGTIVYVEGYGYGRVEDIGGAIRGNSIDLYFDTHREALEWGRKQMRVQVWFPSRALLE